MISTSLALLAVKEIHWVRYLIQHIGQYDPCRQHTIPMYIILLLGWRNVTGENIEVFVCLHGHHIPLADG